jgi:hypothetical protein
MPVLRQGRRRRSWPRKSEGPEVVALPDHPMFTCASVNLRVPRALASATSMSRLIRVAPPLYACGYGITACAVPFRFAVQPLLQDRQELSDERVGSREHGLVNRRQRNGPCSSHCEGNCRAIMNNARGDFRGRAVSCCSMPFRSTQFRLRITSTANCVLHLRESQ